MSPSLSAAELRRYGRQLVLPEVGAAGQQRLKAAHVLLVGAGGLGSPVALYLAAAGVGRLTLVDADRVDETNLHRQLLYGASDVGRPKVEAAAARLAEVNPHVEVVAVGERFAAGNGLELVRDHDVVVDGSDNFPTRYLVNDACVLADRPDVFGSVLRFEGQVAVFWASRGPCYRCLFPEPPPAGLIPDCAEAGVLGALPGLVGALQAGEALKLILGAGEPLVGRFLVIDALTARFREIVLPKSPTCPVCSPRPLRRELVEEAPACAPAVSGGTGEDAVDVTPGEVKRWMDAAREFVLLDVRTPPEHAIARIPGARLLPLQQLAGRVEELDPAVEVVLYCHHGQRSARGAAFLRQRGFRARNLLGGIEAWSLEVDPGVPRY